MSDFLVVGGADGSRVPTRLPRVPNNSPLLAGQSRSIGFSPLSAISLPKMRGPWQLCFVWKMKLFWVHAARTAPIIHQVSDKVPEAPIEHKRRARGFGSTTLLQTRIHPFPPISRIPASAIRHPTVHGCAPIGQLTSQSALQTTDGLNPNLS